MYCLQRLDENFWEEVDQFTFENKDKAITGKGNPRYNGNWVVFRDGHIQIEAKGLSIRELAQVHRFCGGNERDVTGVSLPVSTTGFLRKPEYVQFFIRKRVLLREMGGGVNFKATTTDKEETKLDPQE